MTVSITAARACPHLTVFRASGTRPPLVLVAGIDGYAFVFRELARLLDDDQPVLGLQLLGTESSEELAQYSIEEMAAVFELEVSAACPSGPIIVGGFSMGALPALELARRLQRRGREVPLLISLDGFSPQFYFQKIDGDSRARAHLRALLQHPLPYLAVRRTNLGRRLFRYVGRDWQFVRGIEAGDKRADDRLKQLTVLWERAAERYRPAACLSLALLLIRVSDPELQLGARDDPAYGWNQYVDDVRAVIEVAGNHSSFLQLASNRIAIAEIVKRHVDETVVRS